MYTPTIIARLLSGLRNKYDSKGQIKTSTMYRRTDTRYTLTWSHFLRQNAATLQVKLTFNRSLCMVVGLCMKPVVSQYLVPALLRVKKKYSSWLTSPLPADSSIALATPLKFNEARVLLESTLEILASSVRIPQKPEQGARVLEEAVSKGLPVFFDSGKSMVYTYLEAYTSGYRNAVEYLEGELGRYLAYETLRLIHSGDITLEPTLNAWRDTPRYRRALESLLRRTSLASSQVYISPLL